MVFISIQFLIKLAWEEWLRLCFVWVAFVLLGYYLKVSDGILLRNWVAMIIFTLLICNVPKISVFFKRARVFIVRRMEEVLIA
jgi:hypothetical protein